MEKVKLALIGAGERGHHAYAPYVKMHSYAAEFVAVAEPDPARRAAFAADFGLAESQCYASAEALLAAPKTADAVMICTLDTQHFEAACAAIRQGYALLLEKPISPSAAECLALQALAEEYGTQIMVCHVMRYTKFFRKLKELLDSKAIGEVVSVTHTENVAYWHYGHSYVRGNWRNTQVAAPMILAKCCHDMDILCWLLGSRCESVSSSGGLAYFTAANAPAGAPARCTDGCAHSAACPYYAPALYLDRDETWPVSCLGSDLSHAGRLAALQTGPYGRCVFHCDNNVVDHQTANLTFENGVTVAFTMCAFSNECDRTIKFFGTKGEIRASMDHNSIIVTEFGPGMMTGNTSEISLIPDASGHSGGDNGIMEEFIAVLRGERENRNTIAQSVHSHVMALAAEYARLSHQTVQIAEFERLATAAE